MLRGQFRWKARETRMLVYLAISLATSVFMNWFNRRVALVEG